MERKYVDWLLNSDDVRARVWAVACKLDLEASVLNSSWEVREAVAKQGYGLDRLVGDVHELVRAEVAKQGYGLDVLVDDPDPEVRAAVALQGYELERFLDDPDAQVRAAVAKWAGKNERPDLLEGLLNDPSWRVRSSVARQGYGLEKLVNDADFRVRMEVAWQGYGLEKLVEDVDLDVRKAARMFSRVKLLPSDSVDAAKLDFQPVLADILRPKADSCFRHTAEAANELLFHTIALYLICEARSSERTISNFLRLFFAEVSHAQMVFVGTSKVRESCENFGDLGSLSDCFGRKTSLEIIFEDLAKKDPGHIAVRFFQEYRRLLWEQFRCFVSGDEILG